MQVDNLKLEKFLGKGSFGEVYLTKIAGDNKNYATKIYDREALEKSPQFKYLVNEINILHNLNHPNIVKFIEVKKTKRHFYIVMEYCNGGELGKALEAYQLKYGRAFSEEIVQYLMRQIISAFKHIHENKVMHRDIKLENILLNFETEEDKKNLNMMKSVVKIIDFGFACKIEKNALTYTTIGNPQNMDPILLKKITSQGKIRQLGYDQKADIWSLGAICYEMLIGKAAFDAEDMDELVDKVEKGTYKVPNSLSIEVVSFLNGMLQYESKARLTAEQLYFHQFLQNDIKTFHKMDLKNNELVIDTKKNKTIWSIFNKECEDQLMKISPGHLAAIQEESEGNSIQQQKTLNPGQMNNNNMNNNQPIKNAGTFESNQYPNLNNYNGGYNYIPNPNYPYNGPVLPRGNQNVQNSDQNNQGNNQGMPESNYSYSSNIYNN